MTRWVCCALTLSSRRQYRELAYPHPVLEFVWSSRLNGNQAPLRMAERLRARSTSANKCHAFTFGRHLMPCKPTRFHPVQEAVGAHIFHRCAQREVEAESSHLEEAPGRPWRLLLPTSRSRSQQLQPGCARYRCSSGPRRGPGSADVAAQYAGQPMPQAEPSRMPKRVSSFEEPTAFEQEKRCGRYHCSTTTRC